MPDTLTFATLEGKQRAIRAGFPETMGLRDHRAISGIGRALGLRRGRRWPHSMAGC